jgi:hydroxyethylthiazole kinase-like uncharacterized protein yjeF
VLNLYQSVELFDKRCYEQFGFSEDVLMENAALGMANYIRTHFKEDSSVLIVAGGSNNGADGITLARMLLGAYEVHLYLQAQPKSLMAKVQFERFLALGGKTVYSLIDSDVIVDAMFGSGFRGKLRTNDKELIEALNLFKGFRIACDIPSGINQHGNFDSAFRADVSITMGGYKMALFSDKAKDFVGEIHLATLGLHERFYADESQYKLLEKSDLKLPHRHQKDTHKGSFGHLSVVCGDKEGASILSALAGFSFGAGLVTLITKEPKNIPYSIMQSDTLPKNTTALAIGMGLGCDVSVHMHLDVPMVLDADFFYNPEILKFLDKEVVLTPHPKEFSALLSLTQIGDFSVHDIQENRFELALGFSKKYPNVTLLLKGANMIIAQNGKLFINALGDNRLSKGGSGDVLSGLIGALLAQGYSTLEASIHASLAFVIASHHVKVANYALSPEDIIKEIRCL